VVHGLLAYAWLKPELMTTAIRIGDEALAEAGVLGVVVPDSATGAAHGGGGVT